MQGKDKIFLHVWEDNVAPKTKLQIHWMESGKGAAFLIVNAFEEVVEIRLRCIRQIFFEHLTTILSELVR